MPIVSMFYGIIVYMYFMDNKQHHVPHIHVEYQGAEAVVDITEGELIDGHLPPAKLKMVLAWIEIHRDELLADWSLASRGEPIFRIDPLR